MKYENTARLKTLAGKRLLAHYGTRPQGIHFIAKLACTCHCP